MISGKSYLDQMCRSLIRSNFFVDGLGEFRKFEKLMEFHKQMSNRELCRKLVAEDYPISILDVTEYNDWTVLSGCLKSPFAVHMPGLLPPESEISKFQLCLPKVWKTDDKPVAIHLAGTGDHNFWRRRFFMASGLLVKDGIASLILENPFYGSRKPAEQIRSNLRFVSDIFIMGGSLILESMAILYWLERLQFGPFCLTGISMGGHMASLAASNWHKPIALVPCLSWTSASGVFTRGVMSRAVNWEGIEKQFIGSSHYRVELMSQLPNFKLEPREDCVPPDPERVAATKRLARIKSVLSQALTKVMESLGLSRLFSNRSAFFPLKPSPSSSLEFNPGKNTSFPLARFSFLVKGQGQSVGRSGNFDREFNLKGKDGRSNDEMVRAQIWNYLKEPKTLDRKETVEFMRRMMDHFTHVAQFSTPVDPGLIILVVARDDAYVLREGVTPIHEVWNGCSVRVVNDGHVNACLMSRGQFRDAIRDSINLYRKKYNLDGTLKKFTWQK